MSALTEHIARLEEESSKFFGLWSEAQCKEREARAEAGKLLSEYGVIQSRLDDLRAIEADTTAINSAPEMA